MLDADLAAQFNPMPKKGVKSRARLKEEILRGDELGTKRSMFSNNAILDAVALDSIFDRTLSSITQYFPGLAKLSINKKYPIRIVGG